uniref:Ribose-5-phosphate isomerase n=1 Tax=Fagus sylvatica TaxID=28930 RepID=A0A2N9G7V5_FAGSY
MLLNQGKLHTILGIPTSKKTYDHVVSLETTLSDLDSHPILDLAIDGADKEIHGNEIRSTKERQIQSDRGYLRETKVRFESESERVRRRAEPLPSHAVASDAGKDELKWP